VVADQDGEDLPRELTFEASDMLSNSRDRGPRFDEQNVGIAPRCRINTCVGDLQGKSLNGSPICLMTLAKNKGEPP
jgi:hypothetical protein